MGTATSASRVTLPFASDQPFSVEADRLQAEPSTGRYVAEGDVVIRRPGAALFADRVTFDEAAGTALAEGHVTAAEGKTVLACESVTMHLPELLGGLVGAELHIKSALPPELIATGDRQTLTTYGEDELILHAERADRTGDRRYALSGATFTACDCGEGEDPSWKIRASNASIDLSSGAWLTWPVFYAGPVPILALPIYYLPLGSRRSGLLTPRFSYTPVTGMGATLPLYLALGRSWDATVDATYLSSRGPATGLELRYAPSFTSRGEWRGALTFDFGELASPAANEPAEWSKTRSAPLLRYAVSGRHQTDLEAARVVADVNLLGDPAYLTDFADAYLARQAELTRSRLTVTSSELDGVRVAAGVQLLQDLRADVYTAPDRELRQVRLLSEQRPGPGEVRYRFAELRLDAAPYPLAGDFLLGAARLSVQTFAAPRPEVARFARADLRPELRAPIEFPLGLVLEPSVALRATAWGGRFEGESVSSTRFAVLGRTRLLTELSRDFGGLVHRIRPEVEHAIIPYVGTSGDDVFATHDELDQLAEVHQVRARLVTELVDLNSGTRWAALEAWIGRDLGAPRGGAGVGTSELVVMAESEVPLLEGALRALLNGRVAWDPDAGVVPEVLAGGGLALARGDSITVQYGRFDAAMPAYSFVAPEELVPSATIDRSVYEPARDFLARAPADRLELAPWSPWEGVAIAARAKPFKPLTLAFDMLLSFDDEDVLQLRYGRTHVSPIRTVRGLARWESSCECWGAFVSVARDRDRDGFQVDFGVDLARLGGVGTPAR